MIPRCVWTAGEFSPKLSCAAISIHPIRKVRVTVVGNPVVDREPTRQLVAVPAVLDGYWANTIRSAVIYLNELSPCSVNDLMECNRLPRTRIGNADIIERIGASGLCLFVFPRDRVNVDTE